MRIKHLTIAFFFVVFLYFGLILSNDYGISHDEPLQRNHGLVSAKYISELISDRFFRDALKNVPPLETYTHRYYGVIFHLPAVFVEIATGMAEPELWHFRHAYTFLWFFIAIIFFYLLVSRRYGWKIAIAACLFFILSPRIFTESFYNVKDLVCLSAFTVAIYFCIHYLEKKSFGAAFCLALFSAVAANIRIAGLLLPALTCMFFIIDCAGKSPLNKKMWGSFIFLLALTPLLTVALWPAAWANPIRFLWETMVLSSNYTRWNVTIIYLGDVVRGAALPWHYVPVWFAVTTPLSSLALFLVGLFVMMQNLIKTKGFFLKIKANQEDLFYLSIVIIPVILVILFKSTLYGGWRHLYFIYPAFLLIAVNGLAWILLKARNTETKRLACKSVAACLLLGALVFYSGYVAYWMIRNHPYQYVYFNFLAGNDIANTFDRDYWGVSARAGLEYVTKTDQRKQIKVSGNMVHLENNIKMLQQSDGKRIELVKQADAEYFIETYRNVRGPSTMSTTGREIYSVVIDSFKIMSVFDLTGRRTN